MNDHETTQYKVIRTALIILPSFGYFLLSISGFEIVPVIFWGIIITVVSATLFWGSLTPSSHPVRQKQLEKAKSDLLQFFQQNMKANKNPVDIRDHLEQWLQELRVHHQISAEEYIQLHDLLIQTYNIATASRQPYLDEIKDIEQRRKNLSTQDENADTDDMMTSPKDHPQMSIARSH